MAKNYVLLETVTVGAAGAASVTFNSIPQSGYTDLVVKMSARFSSGALDAVDVQFNGSTSNRSTRRLQGSGSAAASSTFASLVLFGNAPTPSETANTFTNSEMYIPNYTSSNYKSISVDAVTENNATTAYTTFDAGLWSNTAAITQITLTPYSASNFVQYSTFSLYGIAAVGSTPVIAPKATGGDIIDYDGTYWIHTFLSSGTFTPSLALSCDYLVVAGGGGGGSSSGDAGGGGGAGGYLTATSLSVTSGTSYTVTVGGGGASNTSGSNSVFSSITATGGGRGGAYVTTHAGAAGGSGGGGSGGSSSSAGGAASPAGQGNNGGTGNNSNANYLAGGGGGANATGGSVGYPTSIAGSGGAGLSSSYSGSAVTRAGGGGGGASGGTAGSGGSGGGGAGGLAAVGNAGTVNTGGGGGGAGGGTRAGGAGGSGIVIVRYLAV